MQDAVLIKKKQQKSARRSAGTAKRGRQERPGAAALLAFWHSAHTCPQHRAAGAGEGALQVHTEPRTRVRIGQVNLGPKQVSLPLSWQDVHPPDTNTALLCSSAPC